MKLLKRIAVILLAVILLLLFTACRYSIPREEAVQRAESFALAISEARYEDAAELMHPSRETSPSDLKMYFTATEKDYDVTFAGFTIESYTGEKFSAHNTLYEGGYYELTCKASAGDREFEFRIEIVQNEYGYGIHNFHFDFSE